FFVEPFGFVFNDVDFSFTETGRFGVRYKFSLDHPSSGTHEGDAHRENQAGIQSAEIAVNQEDYPENHQDIASDRQDARKGLWNNPRSLNQPPSAHGGHHPTLPSRLIATSF